jgi:hypothetical protein
MGMRFDEETLERFRAMSPKEAFRAARTAVFGARESGSEDFIDVYEQLVEEGILSWDEVEQFDEHPDR